MRLQLIAILLFAASSPGLAEPAGEEAPDRCYRLGTLLDPTIPADERSDHLARLQAAASHGGAFSQNLLGTLYRLGPDHPARLLPRDDAQARDWLRKAAMGGEIYAMAALAEMDLVAGRSMDAMVWAQVMTFFYRRYPPQGAGTNHEYVADLIARSKHALARPDKKALDEEILGNTNAFLSAHAKTIDDAFQVRIREEDQPPTPDARCPIAYDTERWPIELEKPAGGVQARDSRHAGALRRAGYALFYLSVDADGSVSRALVVDSLPGAEHASGLQATVRQMRFNAIEGAPVRGAVMPMVVTTGTLRMKN